MIPTELDETADVHGDDLSDAAKQCRFRAGAQSGGFGGLEAPRSIGIRIFRQADMISIIKIYISISIIQMIQMYINI